MCKMKSEGMWSMCKDRRVKRWWVVWKAYRGLNWRNRNRSQGMGGEDWGKWEQNVKTSTETETYKANCVKENSRRWAIARRQPVGKLVGNSSKGIGAGSRLGEKSGGTHNQQDLLAEGIPSTPQVTGKQQIMVFCWNQPLSLFSGSKLFSRPATATPTVPSTRKTIAVFCTGPRKRSLSLN